MVHFEDISSISPYVEFMGKKYILQQDCYVWKSFEGRTQIWVESPSINNHYLPKEVNPEFIHEKIYQNDEIIGIMPKGSVFTIIGCEQERSIDYNYRRFKATFEDSLFQGTIFNVSRLTDMTKNPPAFKNDLAKPLDQNAN